MALSRGLGDHALQAAAQGVASAPLVGGLLGPDPLLGLLLAALQNSARISADLEHLPIVTSVSRRSMMIADVALNA